ncbi:stage III sporulation protein AF [Clostridium perfringens]|nr:stage III sporulation protein AF [Clostridium perfringens]
MELLKNWISTLCVVIVIISIAHIILPNSSVKKHVKFVFSLIILSVMLSPIIGLLNFNKEIDENAFENKISGALDQREENTSLYDDEDILESVERNLEKALKDEFYENEFEVKLIGKVDFDDIRINIEKAEIKVLGEKKVKKVEKVVVGEEKINEEEKKDSFLEKVEKFVEKELEISHENIIVSYD